MQSPRKPELLITGLQVQRRQTQTKLKHRPDNKNLTNGMLVLLNNRVVRGERICFVAFARFWGLTMPAWQILSYHCGMSLSLELGSSTAVHSYFHHRYNRCSIQICMPHFTKYLCYSFVCPFIHFKTFLNLYSGSGMVLIAEDSIGKK